MSIKKWVLPDYDQKNVEILSKELQISTLVSSVILSRGATSSQQAIDMITDNRDIYSPFDLIDIDKAVSRINNALENYEQITIYGDYDCDGVVSTAILYNYLLNVGANVNYFIPSRHKDGYGMNNDAVKQLHADGTKLIITVDNGITAIEQVELATQHGMDVIITDHHQPLDTLPKAVAIVNPHRKDCPSKFKQLCGAGVCFKLISALEGDFHTTLESYGDLVAVATIGDVVPLVGENRALVNFGIEQIKRSPSIGLRALIDVVGINVDKLDSTTIAFSVVPRINAVGRIGDAQKAVELLVSDELETATEMASNLNEQNTNRQQLEKDIMEQILAKIQANPKIIDPRVIVVDGEFDHGVAGIIASKLLSMYAKPVIVLCKDGDIYKGSARSINHFNLFKALSYCHEYLDRYGGHKLAAGCTISENNLQSFKNKLNEYSAKNHDFMPVPQIDIAKVLCPSDLTVENVEQLTKLAPFGASSESPLFLISDVTVSAITPLSQGKHQKITFDFDNTKVNGLLFNCEKFLYPIGQKVDVVVALDINEYNNSRSVSIKINDIKPTAINQQKLLNALHFYYKIKRGENIELTILKNAVPTREQIGVVYTAIKSRPNMAQLELFYSVANTPDINYCKFRLILDILAQLELITSPSGTINLLRTDIKVNLSQSTILNWLNKTAKI